MSGFTAKRIACWKCSLTTTNRWICADPTCIYGVTPERVAETVANLGAIDKIIEASCE
jgi:hypothetical protein